jgi:hypothetical protein
MPDALPPARWRAMSSGKMPGRELGHDERQAVAHQAGNEMHVARQAVELRPQHRTAAFVAALIAAASCGRRSSASAPLPLSCSSKVCASRKPSCRANAAKSAEAQKPKKIEVKGG